MRYLCSVKWKKFFKHFFDAIGTLSAFATLIGFVGKWESPLFQTWNCFYLIIGIILISLIYTYFQMRSIKTLTLKMRPQLKVTVREGDVLKEKGIIVIPVNNYFDTIVDDEIVAKSSVHGKFVTEYLKEHSMTELNDSIQASLKKNHKKSTTHANRKFGNKESWHLGCCADIEWKGNTYVLFAFTEFNDKNIAHVDSRIVPSILSQLMDHLGTIATDRPVYMPLFGTGLSRLGKSQKRTLLFILDCIEYTSSDKISLPGGLYVDIYSMITSDINLDDINNVFQTNIY